MHDTAQDGAGVRLNAGESANIGRDVVGRDIVNNHLMPDGFAELYARLKDGETAATAELLRMLIDASASATDGVAQILALVAGLVEAAQLQGAQIDALAQSIDLLRREVNLKATIEQQMAALRNLSQHD